MLENTPNQPTKFRTKSWVEINDESCGTYYTNSQIKFKTSMLRSSLCDYSNAYILVKGTTTVAQETAVASNNASKNVIFKNYAPFTSCISRINNTQAVDASYIDVVMQMYDLIEYSDNYLKTSGILWQFYRDVPASDDDSAKTNFTANNVTDSFNIK